MASPGPRARPGSGTDSSWVAARTSPHSEANRAGSPPALARCPTSSRTPLPTRPRPAPARCPAPCPSTARRSSPSSPGGSRPDTPAARAAPRPLPEFAVRRLRSCPRAPRPAAPVDGGSWTLAASRRPEGAARRPPQTTGDERRAARAPDRPRNHPQRRSAGREPEQLTDPADQEGGSQNGDEPAGPDKFGGVADGVGGFLPYMQFSA